MRKFDAIIIGAGHNGLVTAGYLVRNGLNVLVLERRSIVGGVCVTEETFPRHRISTASYVCSLLDPGVVAELELHRFGYAIFPKDPVSYTPHPDGRGLFFWQDGKKTFDEMARFSRRDASHYADYEALVNRLAVFAESQFRKTPPNLPPMGSDDWKRCLSLGGELLALGWRDPSSLAALAKIMRSSVREFLDGHFESDAIKATLATDGVIGFNGAPSTPGSAYVLLHHCMGEAGGKRGLWGFVKGGMGGITQALAKSAQAKGALIQTDAAVAKIQIRSGKAVGVLLENGEEIEAPVIASNVDPKGTFLRLMDRGHLPVSFRSRIEAIKMDGNALKINLVLGELPNFKASPGTNLGPQHKGTIHICPSLEYMEEAWREAEKGNPSRNPMLECCIPTAYDDSLVPPGRHVMSIFVQYAPYHLVQGTWDELGDSYADRVIDVLSEYAPNIKGAIVERQVLSPLDLERKYGLTGGNIFHGDMVLSQLFSLRPLRGWAQYRTPVDGLYLCGSGTHPGGGVTGLPGYNAAREILTDVKAKVKS